MQGRRGGLHVALPFLHWGGQPLSDHLHFIIWGVLHPWQLRGRGRRGSLNLLQDHTWTNSHHVSRRFTEGTFKSLYSDVTSPAYMHTNVPRSRSSRQRTPQPRSTVWKTWRRTLIPLWTSRFWQRARSHPHHGPHSYTLKTQTYYTAWSKLCVIIFKHIRWWFLTVIHAVSPRRYWLVQPVMDVMTPPSGHGYARTSLCIVTAISAVAAGAEQHLAAGQKTSVWPTIFPVAELWRPRTTVSGTQLHRCGLYAPAQVQLRLLGAYRWGAVQPNRRVEGEEVCLQVKKRLQIHL